MESMRVRNGVLLVGADGVIARFPKADRLGRPLYDRVIMSASAWAILPPWEQHQSEAAACGDIVECKVPPGWSPTLQDEPSAAFAGSELLAIFAPPMRI